MEMMFHRNDYPATGSATRAAIVINSDDTPVAIATIMAQTARTKRTMRPIERSVFCKVDADTDEARSASSEAQRHTMIFLGFCMKQFHSANALV
jgi:hypothetical protein